jgi:predicted transcriptional regulator
MTHRRRQVLAEIIRAAENGERMNLSAIARRCGFYDYRNARKVVDDLKEIALMN